MKEKYLVAVVLLSVAYAGIGTAYGCGKREGAESLVKSHMPPHVFKDMDKDHDALVSRDEAMRFIEQKFVALDQDQNGYISRDEAHRGMSERRGSYKVRYKDD